MIEADRSGSKSKTNAGTAGIWRIVAAAGLLLNVLIVFQAPRNVEAIGPFPDSHSYVAQALEMSRGNFKTVPWLGEVGQSPEPDGLMHPSRFGPGFPLVLAPMVGVLGRSTESVLLASALIVLVLVLISTLVAKAIGGWAAGAFTAWVWAVSPFVAAMSRIVMADALIALVAVLAFSIIWWMAVGIRSSLALASAAIMLGLVLGFGLLIHLRLGILIVAAFVTVRNRLSWAWMSVGILPGALALIMYQWIVFGNPFMNGYDYYLPDLELFVWTSPITWDATGDGPWVVTDRWNGWFFLWLCPCAFPGAGVMHHTPPILTGPATFLGLYWVYLPPLLAIPGFVWMRNNWSTPGAQFAVVAIGLNFLLYVFAVGQAVRYLAPSAALLIILSSIQIAHGINSYLSKRLKL